MKEIKQMMPIVASSELLTEMEELQIYGGETPPIIIFALSKCAVTNSGNCVAKCACTDPDPGKS